MTHLMCSTGDSLLPVDLCLLYVGASYGMCQLQMAAVQYMLAAASTLQCTFNVSN